jgi:hypothetical protein
MKTLLIVGIVVLLAFLLWESDDDNSGDGDAADTSNGSAPTDPNQTGVAAILSALAGFENVDPSHNNPGGICGSFDANGNCLGPATYPTLDAGDTAAENLIQSKINKNPLVSVAQFVQNWSGGTGQVLANYINHVASALGLDPSEPIGDAIQ